jgi:hypothetical protein
MAPAVSPLGTLSVVLVGAAVTGAAVAADTRNAPNCLPAERNELL